MTSPDLTVAVVAARWHADLVDRAVTAFTETLGAGRSTWNVEVHHVPGAFEIPLRAKRLALAGVDAVAACALVVDGGIYRHDFVAGSVVDGLMRVQLETDVPVFSAVLTPHHFHEHSEHLSYFAQHLEKKGRELAHALMETLTPTSP